MCDLVILCSSESESREGLGENLGKMIFPDLENNATSDPPSINHEQTLKTVIDKQYTQCKHN